jgi:hypothetical protein
MSTSIVDNATKREGECRVRSQKGVPILEETYSYLVVATSKEEPYVQVLDTPGLPLVGSTVSPSGFGICQTKNATRSTENPLYWTVKCDFSSDVEERTGGNQNNPYTSPTAWIPVYETKFERVQELVNKDLDDTPVVNSVNQPFPEAITVTRKIPMWEFFQFEAATVTDEQVIDRSETVNVSSFRGRAAGTLLLTVLSSVIGFYYGTRLRLTQYSIRYNKKGWQHQRLDVGTVYLDGGILKPYFDNDTDQNIILGNLNGGGAKAAAGAEPAILEFKIYEEIDFNSFLRI